LENIRLKLQNIFILSFIIIGVNLQAQTVGKLPAEKAGTIGEPTGQIAFSRDKNLWVMNADGSNQYLVFQAGNIDGRLSWSSDNKKILFTRSGLVNLVGPDMLGGKHKVYDIFYASLDSAYANQTLWYYRLTDDMGNRDAECSPDGNRIIFWKDMNANMVNAFKPNYQICIMDSDGSNIEILRKDWTQMEEVLCMTPSMSINDDIAFVAFFNLRPEGLVVLHKDSFMVSTDTIKAIASRNKTNVGPSWSPDGKWLAYIPNDQKTNGVYITTRDLKESYLVFEPPQNINVLTFPPSFSPDSKWLTFSTSDGSIWICDIMGNGARRLSGPGQDRLPAWSKAATTVKE